MLGGIFIGGGSTRMDGFPKGLLRLPSGETLLARTVRVVRDAGLEPVLVGDAPNVRFEGIARIEDTVRGRGPLGGLVALLQAAGGGDVVALACDMPRIEATLLRRLIEESPGSAAVAPRRGELWEPLCARYDAARALPVAAARLAADQLSLQGLLTALPTTAIQVEDEAFLVDIDTSSEAAREGLEKTP